MTREVFYLGSTGFAQVGDEHYRAKQLIEKDVLMKALKAKFGSRIEKSGGRLVWAEHPHDYGSYHEMEFHIPEDQVRDSTYNLTSDLESFDWEDPELIREMNNTWESIIPAGKQEVVNRLENIKAMTEAIEKHGGIVMLPEDTDDALANLDKTKTEVGTMETFKNININEYSYNDLLDSLVPACCVYGCQVEPDGTCEHGNPSILLHYGLI
jgi:hypothetical protein